MAETVTATTETIPLVATLPGGKQLSYFDSGPVPGSADFTTLVSVHGLHFNSYGFKHLLPLAPKFNFRLILVQRRDYAGSSQYTPEEMSTLQSDDPTDFLNGTGLVLAQFVHYIIKTTTVCKPLEGRLSGGLSVTGWSLGTAFTLTMFSEAVKLDKGVYDEIEPYVISYIIYDPPHLALGIPTPQALKDHSSPFKLHTPEEQLQMFRPWVSSYYDHISDPTVHEELSQLDARDKTEKCTYMSWPPAQQEEWTEKFPMRSDGIILSNGLVQSHLYKMTTDVLFGLDPERRPFPRTRFALIYAKRTIWMGAVARHHLRMKYSELLAKGHGSKMRPVVIEDVESANHFLHYDSPEEFMKILRQLV